MVTDVQLGLSVAGVSPIPVGGAGLPLRYVNRYVPSPPINILTVTQLTTALLSVFNVASSTLNTGMAILNSSGIAGITGQPGVITVTLYPYDGSASATFTTSASKRPGRGLDANGFLPAGAEWAVLLTDLIGSNGANLAATTFQGSVLFTTNFSNAHGINYIADSGFAVQAQGYEMLVLPIPRALGNAAVPEVLGH
jgi:hypothetical protein